MKKAFVIVCFVSSTLAFAQQTPSPSLNNTILSNSLATPLQKQSLNMESFISGDFKQNMSILSEVLRKSNTKRLKPSTTMPVFEPEGKYFLEIYKVNNTIDYKLKIFDYEKS